MTVRRGAVLLVGALLAAGFTLSAPSSRVAAASQSCTTTSGPNGAYTATACLSVPSPTLTGSVLVTADVALSNTQTLVTFVTFCLDGSATGNPGCVAGGPGYLLRAFERTAHPAPWTGEWTFTLPTGHWPDGSHSLLVVAQLADGTQTQPVSVPVTFSNGRRTQAVNTTPSSIVHPSAPRAGSPFVIGAVGDGGGDEAESQQVGRLVSSWSPNLFLYLGDVYDQGSYTEFADWYDRSFGSLRAITAPVPGNHEYMSSSDPATASRVDPPGTAYFDYWNNLPNFYSFDAAGWHFVALNANPEMGSQRWQDQLDWLESDLSSHASECTVAFWHEPAFNTGTAHVTPEATKLWSLVSGQATLVVNAHDHTYQRWTPMDAAGSPSAKGTAEVIVGTGGHQPTTFTTTDHRVVSRSTDTGALRLEPAGSSMRLDFITTAGRTADSATLPCLTGRAAVLPSSQSPAGSPDQRTLQVSFLVAILLAAAGYLLAALPTRISVATSLAILAASIAALGGGLAEPHRIPAAVAVIAVGAAVVGLGCLLAWLLPRHRLPMFLLLAVIAVAGVGLAAANPSGAPPPGMPAPLLDAARATNQTPLGSLFAIVVAIVSVAVGAHSRMRRYPAVLSIVPPALALILADAIVLAAPMASQLPTVRDWPLLVAALFVVAWLATEIVGHGMVTRQ